MVKCIIELDDSVFNLIFRLMVMEKKKREAKKELDTVFTYEYAALTIQECNIFIDDILNKI